MQRPVFIASVLVILIGIAAGAYVWLRPVISITVASDDNRASLTFRADALPDGIEPGDIVIRREETTVEGHLARYTLEPNGLVFASPATIRVSIPPGDQPATNVLRIALPSIVLTGESAPPQPLATQAELADKQGTVNAQAEISHFSTVDVLSFQSARIDNPSDHVVGEPFFIGARLTMDRTEVRVPIANDPDFVAYVHVMSNWYLQDGTFTSRTAAVTPESIRNAPAGASPVAGAIGRPAFAAVRQFTCANAGDATVAYRVFADGEFKLYMEGRNGTRTEVEVPGADLANQVRLATRPFRCLASEETVVVDPTQPVVLDPGHDTVAVAYGDFDLRITPSATRATVGETVAVDVVVTDISDSAVNALPEAARAEYVGRWQAYGTWHAAPIFDRTEVEVKEYPWGQHLGRLTLRLPLTCTSAGKGTVSFDANVAKYPPGELLPDALHGSVALSEGTRVETPEIECVAPATVQEPQTEPIGLQITPSALEVTHFVGGSSCPQNVGSFVVQTPDGSVQTWSVSDVPPWLSMPVQGTTGEPVAVQFTCNIARTDAHAEETTLKFTTPAGSGEAQVRVNVE